MTLSTGKNQTNPIHYSSQIFKQLVQYLLTMYYHVSNAASYL
jgi:hypothetical protein